MRQAAKKLRHEFGAPRAIARGLAALLSIALAVSFSEASQFRLPPEMGWIGLYNDSLIQWLENENRLNDLCAAFKDDDRDRCREEKLRPRPFLIPLHSAPNSLSKSAGSILLLAAPGRGLRFFYVRPEGGSPREFEPDLNMQDWGYGPYFHQTYLDRRATWFLLPQDPFPRPTWFNAKELGDDPHVLKLGGIVDGPQGPVVVIAVEQRVVRVRHEQPADMWCDSGEPPPLKPSTVLRIPKRKLYSQTGHLLVAPAYMKGC